MKLTIADLQQYIVRSWVQLRRYLGLIFVLLLIGVYAFLALRISSLTSSTPAQTEVDARLKTAAVPHIDKTALKKIQDLQDNSVSVKALFNEARSNPFQD